MTDPPSRRVAVVNWRDPWHPAAGGAEVYAWEIGRRLAASGARVTFVTARGDGQSAAERRDGIDIVRTGGTFSVYPKVLGWLAARRRRFDAVIDCQNGIPFFTPLVLPRRTVVVGVVHHVHDKQFGVHFPGWLAAVGRALEGPVARRVYRRHVTAAVSPSTEAAMRDRLGWLGPIAIVPNGCLAPPADLIGPAESAAHAAHVPHAGPVGPAVARSASPSLVCVGRLVAHKRVERIVALALALRERWPDLTVHVVGRGPEEARIRALADACGTAGGSGGSGATPAVTFHGYLSDRDKARLVAGSWLHVSASQGEGWGLSVLEAAALGVPTVAYDVDGLRDAVRPGRTGWLAGPGDTLEGVAEAALKELSDPVRHPEVAAACRSWAARFDWDASAARMAALISWPVSGRGEIPPCDQAWDHAWDSADDPPWDSSRESSC